MIFLLEIFTNLSQKSILKKFRRQNQCHHFVGNNITLIHLFFFYEKEIFIKILKKCDFVVSLKYISSSWRLRHIAESMKNIDFAFKLMQCKTFGNIEKAGCR